MKVSCSAPGRAALAAFGEHVPTQRQYEASAVERRSTVRRAADQPVNGGGPSFRLGDVYADELDRLRAQAQAEGFAAGHAEGLVAADAVVAEAERAAAERLADVQARWERRLASATAALSTAATRLDESTPAGRRRHPGDDRRHRPHPARGPAGP